MIALCIDGGGMRGVIPATVLTFIEFVIKKYTKNNVFLRDYFDIISGASVGSVIASLTILGHHADEILKIIISESKSIFTPNCFSCCGITRSVYNKEQLRKTIRRILLMSKIKLSEVPGNLMINTLDINTNKPIIFKSWKARESVERDYFLEDVIVSSCAAPYYFTSNNISNIIRSKFNCTTDGGLCQNNPSLLVYNEYRKSQKFNGEPCVIISLGTGTTENPPKYDIGSGGIISWGSHLLNVLTVSSSEFIEYTMEILSRNNEVNYCRIQPLIISGNMELDNTDINNIIVLINETIDHIVTFYSETIEIIEYLEPNISEFAIENKEAIITEFKSKIENITKDLM